MSDQFDHNEPLSDHLADTDRMRPVTEPTPDHLADTGPVRTIREPVPDHLADTGPIRVMRRHRPIPLWRRAFGCLFLLSAAGLTLATILMLVLPGPETAVPTLPPSEVAVQATTAPPTDTVAPLVTETDETVEPIGGETVAEIVVLPTANPEVLNARLNEPLQAASGNLGMVAVRNILNPFTIIPDRPRSEVITYTVQQGDTIFKISEQFGLDPESIAWANPRNIIAGLRPGMELNILPVDGVYHRELGDATIAQIAAQYEVDPFDVIDSEYNTIFGLQPEDTVPSGTWLVIPGGVAEQIAWNPVVERIPGDGSGASGTSAGGFISFAPGDPGSCGQVANPGGGGGWARPMADYEWSRGYTGWHTGVDLSASPGTPVFAARSGAVIFAGWSTWGYGYTVVLAHGNITTVYAHLSSINVGCAQVVGAGQVIGSVGATGNASGPHLHFEVRSNDFPTDPTLYMAF